MNTRQKIAALIDAHKNGTEPPVWAGLSSMSKPLNNLNIKARSQFNPMIDTRRQLNFSDLNNLKSPAGKKGVPRLELYTDEALKKAIGWGVEEWLLQVCIQEYGIYAVKAQINRIYQIPEGYFKPKYGPIAQQRGRIFNKEMQKLKQSSGLSRNTNP